MKVAIYSHSIAPSIDGVCRRFTGILHEMEKQGYETLLFTMEEFPLELPKSTKTVTLDHIIFPTYPNKKVAWPTAKSFTSIMMTLAREKPDVRLLLSLASIIIFSFNRIVFVVLGHSCRGGRVFSDVHLSWTLARNTRCWILPHGHYRFTEHSRCLWGTKTLCVDKRSR